MSVNKVFLLGIVDNDPKVHYFDNGGAVANFTLITTEDGYVTANGTQIPDRTELHNIVLWNNLAKFTKNNIKKGSKIYIEGKFRKNSHETNGIKYLTSEIWGSIIELMDSSKTGEISQNETAYPLPF